MSFDTIFFVFTWLPCFLVIFFVTKKQWKPMLLLIASYLFYAWGNVYQVIFLIGMTWLHYQVNGLLQRCRGKQRWCLFLEVLIFDIVVLCYFKYYGDMMEGLFGVIGSSSTLQFLPAPLGISFYMFSLIGYLIDGYCGKLSEKQKYVNVSLYIAFFPKLLMGPICRYQEFEEQLASFQFQQALFDTGATRFLVGLAQKVILANTFAQLFQQVQTHSLSILGCWVMSIAFALQLYYDFHGYSQMAIGLSNMLGFTMPENFRYPYLSCSIKDFWGRWHITLGQWFKTYVYIPLGGNRISHKRTMVNLMIVWLLTGLWHGVHMTFLMWGAYYGCLLIMERFFWSPIQSKLPKVCNWLITMVLVLIGWVFFYSESLPQAFGILQHMMGFGVGSLPQTAQVLAQYGSILVIGCIGATPLMESIGFLGNMYLNKGYYLIKLVILFVLLMVCIAFMVGNTYQSFLYFAF